MDSSAVSPDGNANVFSSPNTSFETPTTEKFQTSVSVSSLTEKFERSGDFGSVAENNDVAAQICAEFNGIKSFLEGEQNAISRISEALKKDCAIDENESIENNVQAEQQSFKDSSDTPAAVPEAKVSCVCVGLQSSDIANYINTAFEEVKNNPSYGCVQPNVAKADINTAAQNVQNMKAPCVQPAPSAGDSNGERDVQSCSQDTSEFTTDEKIRKVVEEKVACYVENISKHPDTVSKEVQKSVPVEEAASYSSYKNFADISGIVQNMSFKDLEQSFVTALKMANCYEKVPEKTEGTTLPVPSIHITEASDREDSSSDDIEGTKPKCVVKQVVTAVNEMEESDKELSTNKKQIPSTSTASQCEEKDEPEISPEERRSLFYTSSDLPANEPLENSDEFPLMSSDPRLEEHLRIAPILIDDWENRSSFCLCSKSVHGMIFLTCFIFGMGGFILYHLGHDHKAPDFCEYLGLVIAIIAGIIGAFSCVCYSVLEAFPGMPDRYERMRESRKIKAEKRKIKSMMNLDEESWSPATERAFRIQNGMSSTRTSAASMKNYENEFLLVRQSDHKELVDTAEKMKKDVVGLLDSVSDVMARIKLMEK